MKTFLPKVDVQRRKWRIIDAKGAVLGRLAVQVADALRGKDKPTDVLAFARRIDWSAEEDGFPDRYPGRLRVTLDDGRTYPVTVIVVHQRSLNGANAASSSGDRVRAKRAKQAEFLAQLVDDLQTANPDEKIALVGDFNAFDVNDGYVDAMGITTGNPAPASEVIFWADSPLSTANGGTPLIMGNELIADPEQRYSYIFGNITQSLDHAVVNEALTMDPGVSDVLVDHARVNADFRHGHFADFDPPYSVANPPLRTSEHLTAVRAALADGTIDMVGTDHAPHAASDKAKPCLLYTSPSPRD